MASLGRLLARLTVVAGGKPPTVWEVDENRMAGANRGTKWFTRIKIPRQIINPFTMHRVAQTYLDQWIQRCGRGAEIVLSGFYSDRINFAFPHAFMREVKFRIAAEWGNLTI